MENELSRLLDALPGLVWSALPDGHADYVNQRWCEYTGLSIDATRSLGWQVAIHAEDLPQMLERWQIILASGEPGELEARLRRLDGAYRWFLLRVSPLADESGRLVKWCGIGTDIEDRKQAERALRASEDRFRSIVDGLPAFVSLMTPTGETEFANRDMLGYFGATLEEIKASSPGYTFHPDDYPHVLAAWIRITSKR